MSGRAQHGLSNAIAISLINRFPKKLLTLLEVTVAFTNKYSNTQILKTRINMNAGTNCPGAVYILYDTN